MPAKFTKLLRLATLGTGTVFVGFGALMVVSAISFANQVAKRNQRRERIGDDGERNYPKTELVAHKHWQDMAKVDFRNMTRLEYQDNLYAILKAMAEFYQLKINKEALAF